MRRRSGPAIIRPTQITEAIADDPVLEIAWPRPDFRLAAIEFLIGLLSTFAPPADEEEWGDLWDNPPSPEALDAAFRSGAHAFTLDGDGPRFMQDFAPLDDGAENPAGALLIEAPGAQTLRNNADLLIRRGRVNRLSRGAAAMALFTLQTYAPGGGAGHRVGLRGGGPLTTLILPRGEAGQPAPLWRLLWAHVQPGKPVRQTALAGVLPWLGPTATSEEDGTAIAAKLAPEHVFWGMPRRIRLVFEANPEGLVCDLTGVIDPLVATGWRARPYGLFYKDWSPPHPLSPHYRQKKTEPWLPVHGQPSGIGYRDWVGLVVADEGGLRAPADAVTYFRLQRARGVGQTEMRLLAAGYDMDNMKARGFVESEMPLPPAGDAGSVELVDALIRALVRGANIAADRLRYAVRNALFSPGAKIDITGATLFAAVREAFWRDTERAFFDRLTKLPAHVAEARATETLTRPWLNVLRVAALACFDGAAPLDPERYRDDDDGQAIVRARGFLVREFSGFGTGGAELFKALVLTVPESKKPKAAGRGA